jgi:UDP-N-acetylglucosamine 2-epimerase (non-hydrolysing)
MKIAPLYHALKKESWVQPIIVHTGQHYDANMSGSFFDDLDLPSPDINLGVGSGTHAEQTGDVMIAYEKVLMECKPDMVIVVGDVNSTAACTMAASKISYPSNSKLSMDRPLIAHLEAGLRSYDRRMPEEINRLVTDVLADMLWTPSRDADRNLIREGVPAGKIHMVGNIMIDSLEMMRPKIEVQDAYLQLNLEAGHYGIVTLHRPSNVDDLDNLTQLCESLQTIARRLPLVFPVHPRTRKKMEQSGLMGPMQECDGLIMPEPMPYIRFMSLVFNCRLVITDSGGIQEKTSYLGIPCLTVRENTERPVTITHGTNQLCKLDQLQEKTDAFLNQKPAQAKPIEFWDGKTADRIVSSIKDLVDS